MKAAFPERAAVVAEILLPSSRNAYRKTSRAGCPPERKQRIELGFYFLPSGISSVEALMFAGFRSR